MPLPLLPEQKRTVAILDKADRCRRLRRYTLQLSDNLLQSVFPEMFGDPCVNPKGWEKCIIDDVLVFRNMEHHRNQMPKSAAIECSAWVTLLMQEKSISRVQTSPI